MRWQATSGLALALLALVPLLVALAQPASAAEAVPRYAIQIDLDYPSASAIVQQRVEYTNRTGAPLATLAFNVTPRRFGAFTLTAAAVDGQPVQPAFDGVSMELPLPSPLAPGATAAVALSYRLNVPDQAHLRFGRSSGVLALGNFHPTVQVFKDGRWPRYAYTDVGDAFFTESADYDVTLAVAGAPPGLKVAHSGDLVEQSDSRWVFRGRQLRDFALALSERYQVEQRTVGATTVTAFYLPEHAAGGRQMLQSAVGALAWGNANLGVYPYATLQVAETGDPAGSGQEYPTAIFVGSGDVAGATGSGSYLAYLVAHEVMHQWFYGLVGDDQLEEPWLDEAPATQLGYLYLRATAPSAYQSMWAASVVQRYRDAVAAWGDRPLDSSVYDFPDGARYFALLYRKGALFLDATREQMGDAAYFAALRDFGAEHRHGIVTTTDFLTFLASRAGGDFPALVRRNFSASAYQAAFGRTPSPTPSPSATPSATPTGTPTPRPSATQGATSTPTTAVLAATATPAAQPGVSPTATGTVFAPLAGAPASPAPTPAALPSPALATAAIEATAQPAANPTGDLPALVAGAALGVGLGAATAYVVGRRRLR